MPPAGDNRGERVRDASLGHVSANLISTLCKKRKKERKLESVRKEIGKTLRRRIQ